MDMTEKQKLEMLAYESFIRRASEIDMPFMLKGSYVTRQYFPTDISRIPADLDWVYMDPLSEPVAAKAIFSRWITTVTEAKTNDGVEFRSFRENAFWRMMDYAMADDFPTVNTDIKCWINGVEFDFDLDISFNLEIPGGSTPLNYKPATGPDFLVPHTAPLHLQVAWKIHQTLVRPRFKDLFDLMYLVQHSGFNQTVLSMSFEALLKECAADKVGLEKIQDFLNYDLHKLFNEKTLEEIWAYWRHGKYAEGERWAFGYNAEAKYITNANRLPIKLEIFIKQFRESMEAAGFTPQLIDEFPEEIFELDQKVSKRKNLASTPDNQNFMEPVQKKSIPETTNTSSVKSKLKAFIDTILKPLK